MGAGLLITKSQLIETDRGVLRGVFWATNKRSGHYDKGKTSFCFTSPQLWEAERCHTSMWAERDGGVRRVNKMPTRKQKMRLKETSWP